MCLEHKTSVHKTEILYQVGGVAFYLRSHKSTGGVGRTRPPLFIIRYIVTR